MARQLIHEAKKHFQGLFVYRRTAETNSKGGWSNSQFHFKVENITKI